VRLTVGLVSGIPHPKSWLNSKAISLPQRTYPDPCSTLDSKGTHWFTSRTL
jgi:hypothetical protein